MIAVQGSIVVVVVVERVEVEMDVVVEVVEAVEVVDCVDVAVVVTGAGESHVTWSDTPP